VELTTFWFIAVAVLFTGYFVLEGFDFGVGVLLPVLGRDDRERRVLINTIGPVWDGNEVWLVAAGGAMFAAFPEWYATLFSGFYLPLLLVLVALIVRGVAFEYRGKRDDPRWRARWDRAIVTGSLLPAVLWGVAFANILRGVPVDAAGEYVGDLWTLLNPYALLGGATTLALFTIHGAVFLALKTSGEVRHRAAALARRAGPVAAVALMAFLGWTAAEVPGGPAAAALAAGSVVALVAGLAASRASRDGRAFAGTAAAIGLAAAAQFTALFPQVLPSTIDPAYSLTTTNAAASPYPLRIMTWVALIFLPLVIGYQAWSYWVLRRRLDVSQIPPAG
jgi:cytochrome d ubiquinol oxidase subunit II